MKTAQKPHIDILTILSCLPHIIRLCKRVHSSSRFCLSPSLHLWLGPYRLFFSHWGSSMRASIGFCSFPFVFFRLFGRIPKKFRGRFLATFFFSKIEKKNMNYSSLASRKKQTNRHYSNRWGSIIPP